MSEEITIETTEDQRRAAAAFCLPVDSAGNPPSYTDHWVKTGDPGIFRSAGASPVVLACLFAEREAKIQREASAIDERKSRMLCDRDVVIDTLRAEVEGLKVTMHADFREIEKLQDVIVQLSDALSHAMPCVQAFYSDRGERGDSDDVYALHQFDSAFKLATKYQTPLPPEQDVVLFGDDVVASSK